MTGGWRIIRTLGSKMIKLNPPQGFAAEATASIIIGGASHFGIPLSTTQVISTSIMGLGATQPAFGGTLGDRRPDRLGIGIDDSAIFFIGGRHYVSV